MATSDKAPGPVGATIPPTERRWALVTGATGGLGAAFARWLAAHDMNLVITGRDTMRLASLTTELESSGAQVISLPVDLADREARSGLVTDLTQKQVHVDTLVNNAGFGIIGDVSDTDPGRLRGMLEVNVVALTDLTRSFLPAMLEVGQGSIINVASTASFQPIPGMAAYAASKAYVRSFSTALSEETRGTGVRVITINPGPTESGFFSVAGDDNTLTRRRRPEQVVETTFAALAKGHPSIVDGPSNAAMAMANRFVPTSLSARIAARMLGRH